MEENPYEAPKTIDSPRSIPKRRAKTWWDYALVILVSGIFGLILIPLFSDFLRDGEEVVAAILAGATLGLTAYRFVP